MAYKSKKSRETLFFKRLWVSTHSESSERSELISEANKAIETNAKAYWLFLLKGKAQKALGDKAGAKESATTCIKLATDAKNDDYIRSENEVLVGL